MFTEKTSIGLYNEQLVLKCERYRIIQSSQAIYTVFYHIRRLLQTFDSIDNNPSVFSNRITKTSTPIAVKMLKYKKLPIFDLRYADSCIGVSFFKAPLIGFPKQPFSSKMRKVSYKSIFINNLYRILPYKINFAKSIKKNNIFSIRYADSCIGISFNLHRSIKLACKITL